jgi:hypothetical protein
MIPYGLPLIYSTFACDAAPSVRLFLLPLSPPPWGSLQTREAQHDDEDSQQKRPRAVHRQRKLVSARDQSQRSLHRRAHHVAEHGGAYWLLDEIAIIQPYNKAVAAEEFQVWKLAVRPARTATLTCDDGNGNIVFTKEIEHTDFPLDEITLYFTNNVIHLPSEY